MNGAGCIAVRGLTRRFGNKVAVHPLEFEMGPGGITGLLGPNGSGKSTLLRMLCGLVRPDSGSAEVDGIALAGDGTAVRQRCTYAPGEIALYGDLRGRDHLRWFMRGRGDGATRRAFEIAGELGLPLARRVHQYSHGMKRQLMFSAAMAPDVRVRILDEPSEGLDPSKRSALADLLREDAARGTTILLSSHHLGEVDRVCERFIFLNEGRLVAIESAAEVRERAERLVRLTYGAVLDQDVERTRIQAVLGELGVVNVHGTDHTLAVELREADPRPFLAALGDRADLPRPTAIEYGEVSLADLYSGIYGVEVW